MNPLVLPTVLKSAKNMKTFGAGTTSEIIVTAGKSACLRVLGGGLLTVVGSPRGLSEIVPCQRPKFPSCKRVNCVSLDTTLEGMTDCCGSR